MTIPRVMGGLYSCTPRGPDMQDVHVSPGQSLGPGSRALSSVEGLRSHFFPIDHCHPVTFLPHSHPITEHPAPS